MITSPRKDERKKKARNVKLGMRKKDERKRSERRTIQKMKMKRIPISQ